ncbi:MAG: flagellar motor protein MotB [Clostridiales bacterium]|jgi:chemotaxis protein MotB|nr:flagellar motor protein MotB [Clostridiales bacterium]
MAKKKPDEAKGGVPEYMATYGDMVTLILCFFVLLYAMSSIDMAKFAALASSFSGGEIALLPSEGGSTLNDLLGSGLMEMPALESPPEAQSREYVEAQAEMREMVSELTTYFEENNLFQQVNVELGNQEIIINMKESVLFDSGEAVLKPEAYPILEILAAELMAYPDNDIEVIGHTDSDPIHTIIYPSNLYLSCARAVSVATYFIDGIGMPPLRILPYGRGELMPVAPNDTAENKAKNRRVEMRVKSRFYSEREGE